MFVAARSVAKAGDKEVVFELRMPSTGPRPPGENAFRGRVRQLYAAAVSNAVYALEMQVRFKKGADTYQSFLSKPFEAGKFHSDLEIKMKSYFERVAANFPDMASVPSCTLLWGTGADEDKARWAVVLPPFTTLTTDSPFFFKVLGISADSLTVVPTELEPGVSFGQTGLENRTNQELTFNGKVVLRYESLMRRIQQLDAAAALPAKVNLETRYLTDWLPQTLYSEKTLSVGDAVQSISLLVKNGLKMLNLREDAVNVTASTDVEGEMVIATSEERDTNSKLTVELLFPGRVSHFLGVPQGTALTFPLNDHRMVALRPRRSDEPLLRQWQPLMLLAEGGWGCRANSWVVSGWDCVLALMGRDDKFHGGGLEFFGDEQRLGLTLVDKHLKVVKFAEDTEFSLVLELEPIEKT